MHRMQILHTLFRATWCTWDTSDWYVAYKMLVFIFTLYLYFKLQFLYLYMAKQTDEVKIKYRSAVRNGVGRDGAEYMEFEHDFITASTKSSKRYNNAMCLLMGINGCPHHLIDWISGSTGDRGFINNNKITRNSFIEFHSKHRGTGNKTYGHDAVNKAFKKLSDDGFLIYINKGVYKLNPLMYFAGEDDDRIKSIRMMMEFKSGIDTKITMEVNKK